MVTRNNNSPGVVRAVRIDWDYGKTTILITSLPRQAVGASLVVKTYFDRWPREELQFRSTKSFACLNRVAGYGKKKLPDERVRNKQKELQARISVWRKKLGVPLKAMADQEEQSDTPRGAGGLVSGAASKAVVPLVEASR